MTDPNVIIEGRAYWGRFGLWEKEDIVPVPAVFYGTSPDDALQWAIGQMPAMNQSPASYYVKVVRADLGQTYNVPVVQGEMAEYWLDADVHLLMPGFEKDDLYSQVTSGIAIPTAPAFVTNDNQGAALPFSWVTMVHKQGADFPYFVLNSLIPTWDRQGGPSGTLGYPVANYRDDRAIVGSNGAFYRQAFKHGILTYHSSETTQENEIHTVSYNTYNLLISRAANKMVLVGRPTGDTLPAHLQTFVTKTLPNGIKIQVHTETPGTFNVTTFEHGTIYEIGLNAYALSSAINDLYKQSGGLAASWLGLPIADMQPEPDNADDLFVIFQNGSIHWITAENRPVALHNSVQTNWRYCNKCHGLFFAGRSGTGVCPNGDGHDGTGSGNYAITMTWNGDPNAAQEQAGWKFCSACYGMTFGGANSPRECPATGDAHDHSQSGDYSLWYHSVGSGQINWRWCKNCQTLFFAGADTPSACWASGKAHDGSASGDYTIEYIG